MHAMDAITSGRTLLRRSAAAQGVSLILADAKERGVSVTVVGSFARNDFRLHSDIDLLVHGKLTPARRAMVERMVANRMRGNGIPYDLVFEADMTPEDLRRLLDGDV